MTPMRTTITSLILLFFISLISLISENPSFAQIIGWPPGKPDSKLLNVVPDSVLLVSTWTAAGEIDPDGIPTEKWLAQNEIQEALTKFKSAVSEYMAENAGSHDGANFARDGLWRLLNKPGAVYISRFPSGDEQGEGAIAFNVGTDKDHFEKLLVELGRDDSVTTFEVGENTGYRVDLSDTVVEIGFVGDYLIAALGTGQWEPTIERFKAQTSPPSWLTKQMESSSIERLSTFTYVDIEKLFALTKQLDENSIAEFEKYNKVLRLDELKSACMSTGMDSISSITRLRVECGRSGICSLLDVEAISEADLAAIPNDSVSVIAMKVSVDNSLAMVKEILELAEVDSEEFGLELISEELGIDIEKDVLAHLEGTIVGYSSGSIISPRSVMWMKVDDSKTAEKTIVRINELIQENAEENNFTFTEKTSRNGITTYGIKFDFGVQGFNWALHEDHIYLSNNSRAIASHIRKANDSEGKVPSDPLVKEILVSAKEKGLGQPIGLQRIDFGPIAEAVFPILQTFLGNQTLPGFDFSFADVPSADILTKNFRPNTSFMFKSETGYESFSRHDLPVSIEASTGILIGMLLPAVQQVRSVARTAQSQNNLRQLQLALLNYESAFGKFPASYSTNEKGEPLLSWRVHILPFLEESELYEQFRLNEPWDSDHNKQLIDQMPIIYVSPQLALGDGKTVFVAPVGEDTIIRLQPVDDGEVTGNSFVDMVDGSSNTVLLCEAGENKSVIWTAPSDLSLEELDMDFDEVIDTGHVATILLGLADGSVVKEPTANLTLEYFKGICNMSDGVLHESIEQ